LTRRGSKGVINIRTTERNGPVVALRAVTDEDALMLISANGILLRMSLDQLRDIGRATQGVRLIRVKGNDRVVAVARVASEREEREAEGLEAAPPTEGEVATAETDTALGAPGDAEDSVAEGPAEPSDPDQHSGQSDDLS
jgi:DNA gyrase subunit A